MKKQFNADEWLKVTPEIGELIPWTDVVAKPFRVLDFDRNGTIIKRGKVKARSLFRPYGYLMVERPGADIFFKLPITHKVDFRLIESVYDSPEILSSNRLEDRDMVVVYAPKRIHKNGLAKGISHVLHFAITPAFLIDEYYHDKRDEDIDNLPILFGKLHFTTNLGVYLNKNSERFNQIKVTLEAINGGDVSNSKKRELSVKIIDQSILFSSQKKKLVEKINKYYS